MKKLLVSAHGSAAAWPVLFVLLAVALLSPVTGHSQCSAPPTITQQPTSKTVLGGTHVVFSVRASFSSACPTTYEWFFRYPGLTEFYSTYETLPDFSTFADPDMSGISYRCVVSNAAGSVTSNIVTLTSSPGTCSGVPNIILQPTDTTANEGSPVTFSVQVATPPAGCTTRYQWRKQVTGDDNEENIPGANGPSYTFIASRDLEDYAFDCVVSNGAGTVFSDKGYLEVINRGTIVHEAESLIRSSNGASTALQNDASASGGKWVALQADGVGDYVDFTIPNIPAGEYIVRLKYKEHVNRGIAQMFVDGAEGNSRDQYSAVTGYPEHWFAFVDFATSGSKVIRLRCAGKNPSSGAFTISADRFMFEPVGPAAPCTVAPVISVQPQDQNVLEGDGVILFVNADASPAGCPHTYQWRFIESVDHGPQPMNWPDSLNWIVIYPTRDTQYFTYDVVVSNAAGSVVSREVRIDMTRAGTITKEAESLARSSTGASTKLESDANTSGGKWISLLADGINDSVDFTLPNIPAGEYFLRMKYKGHPNRGILDLSINGSPMGLPLDQYIDVPAYPEAWLGDVNFSTSGNKVIRLKVAGKRAAAGTFTLSADQFILEPR
jgi:hypothetical protein